MFYELRLFGVTQRRLSSIYWFFDWENVKFIFIGAFLKVIGAKNAHCAIFEFRAWVDHKDALVRGVMMMMMMLKWVRFRYDRRSTVTTKSYLIFI